MKTLVQGIWNVKQRHTPGNNAEGNNSKDED